MSKQPLLGDVLWAVAPQYRQQSSWIALMDFYMVRCREILKVGIICLAYPLKNPAVATERKDVLKEIPIPVLFVSGTKDPMCNIASLKEAMLSISVPNQLVELPGGDHGFKANKTNFYTTEELIQQQNEAVRNWILSFASFVRKRDRPGSAEELDNARPLKRANLEVRCFWDDHSRTLEEKLALSIRGKGLYYSLVLYSETNKWR